MSIARIHSNAVLEPDHVLVRLVVGLFHGFIGFKRRDDAEEIGAETTIQVRDIFKYCSASQLTLPTQQMASRPRESLGPTKA